MRKNILEVRRYIFQGQWKYERGKWAKSNQKEYGKELSRKYSFLGYVIGNIETTFVNIETK